MYTTSIKNTIKDGSFIEHKLLSPKIPFSYSLNGYFENEYEKLKKSNLMIVFVEGQPYDTYEQMKADYDKGVLKISTDYSYNTIWGSPLMNWKFRAVHDSHHVKYDLDFSPESEKELTRRQLVEYAKDGLCEFDIELLRIEMNGQVEYYEQTGQFPENQRLFTIEKLKEWAK